MRRRTAVLAILFGLLMPSVAAAGPGILVLAHDGTPQWTAVVKELAARVDTHTPAEVMFGPPGRSSLAPAVERLAQRGVTEVVAVPFFFSGTIAPEDLKGHPIPVRIAPASDAGEPLFAEIVASRADEIGAARSDVLVIAGYGSNDGGKPWVMDLAPLARRLNGTRRFASILTIARPGERTQGEQQQLRVWLERHVAGGKTIVVVPILGPQGESGGAVEQMLQGFSYRTAKGAVLTDDRVVDWVARQAAVSTR